MQQNHPPYYLVGTLLFGAAFIACTVLFIILTTQARGLFRSRAPEGQTSGVESAAPSRHLAAILPDDSSSFSESLETGMRARAQELNLLLEIRRAKPEDQELNAAFYLKNAILSRVDAILLYLIDPNPAIMDLIEEAWQLEIPVITMVNDLPQSRRSAFVGPNSYQLGVVTATIIRQSWQSGTIGLILNQAQGEDLNQHNELLLQGINASLFGIDRYTLLPPFLSPGDQLSGELVMQEILQGDPLVDIIVSTNPKDTLGIIQSLTENNMVGDIGIIGYDMSGDLERYLARRIVHASLNRLPWHVGYRSVHTAFQMKTGQEYENPLDPGIIIQFARDLQYTNPSEDSEPGEPSSSRSPESPDQPEEISLSGVRQ